MIEVDPLLSPRKVAELVGLARESLFDMTRKGKFPKPVKISTTRVAYVASEIAEWIEARKQQRGNDEMRRISQIGAEVSRRVRAQRKAGEL